MRGPIRHRSISIRAHYCFGKYRPFRVKLSTHFTQVIAQPPMTRMGMRTLSEAREKLHSHAYRHLKRLTARQAKHPTQNAFITKSRDPEELIEIEAARLEKGISTPSRHKSRELVIDAKSQSIAVKDNIVTSGGRSTAASKILENYQSPFNASVIEALQEGHAFIVGKTNLDEFGMGSHSTNSYFGQVRNVWPLNDHSAGGSSGGSAVAVAVQQAQVALGTDTGGSVRLPAAYTGVVGFKPSYGEVSRWGVIPYANSLDTVGFLASDVKQLNKLFEIAMAPDEKDPTNLKKETRQRLDMIRQSANPFKRGDKIRIGVPVEYNIEELDPMIRETWQIVLERLQSTGDYEVIPVSLPSTKQALSAYYVLAAGEAASNLAKYDGVRYGFQKQGADGSGGVLYAQTRGEGFGDEVRRRILLGSYTLSSEAIDNYFIKAQKIRRLVQRDFDRVFTMQNGLRPVEQFDLSEMDENVDLESKLGPAQVDFLICPTAPTKPPTLEEVSRQTPLDSYINDIFTVPASLAGLPAISVPVKTQNNEAGNKPFPVGIQIISQYANDWAVIQMGLRVQSLYDIRS